jgi:hypothetical protein
VKEAVQHSSIWYKNLCSELEKKCFCVFLIHFLFPLFKSCSVLCVSKSALKHRLKLSVLPWCIIEELIWFGADLFYNFDRQT